MVYVRLEEGDDWGCKYLTREGQRYTAHGTADAKRGIPFQPGDHVHVRWPTGRESYEHVVMKRHDVTIMDMGHEYRTGSFRPGVETDVHGVTHWTPLALLEVAEEDIAAIESKVSPR